MNKTLGIFGLLIFVCLFTALFNPAFVSEANLFNITRQTAQYGILSLGVAFVIITGGIDLSIGSVVGLGASLLLLMISDWNIPPSIAIPCVIAVCALIGLVHGLLITRVNLQPFVVTLCGLLVYRGAARWISDDRPLGLGTDYESIRLLGSGAPFSYTTLAIGASVVAILFGLYHALVLHGGQASSEADATATKSPKGSPSVALLQRWSWLLVGVLLLAFAFISPSSETKKASVKSATANLEASTDMDAAAAKASNTPLIKIKKDRVKNKITLEQRVSRPAFILPAAVFLPTFLTMIVGGWTSKRKVILKPMIASLLAAGFLVAGVLFLLPVYQSVIPGDLFSLGFADVSGRLVAGLIMVSLFAILASAVGAAIWLLSAAASCSPLGKALLPLTGFAGLLTLLSMTSLMSSMVPAPMLIMIALAVVSSVVLNCTVFGRYLKALGHSEEAARYSGINTKNTTMLAYVFCSTAAGLGGVLFALQINSVQASVFGNFYELYAIAAAVLGGCSLRGGDGNIIGVVIGAAIIQVLYNSITVLRIGDKLEFAIVGMVILCGVMVDEIVRNLVAKRALLKRDSNPDGPPAEAAGG